VVCIEKRCGSILRSPNTNTLAAAFSDHWRPGLAAAFRDVSARNMVRDLPHCAIVEPCQVTLELPMTHSCKVEGAARGVPGTRPAAKPLERVIETVEPEFAAWARHTESLRRLCAIL